MGPASTTTFLATLHVGHNRLLQIALVRRRVLRSVECAQQVTRQIGATELAPCAGTLEERRFQSLADHRRSRDPSAARFVSKAPLEDGGEFEGNSVHS